MSRWRPEMVFQKRVLIEKEDMKQDADITKKKRAEMS